MWILHVLPVPVPVWLLLGTPALQTGVRLIGHSKLSIGVNVNVDGCLSLYVSPAFNW